MIITCIPAFNEERTIADIVKKSLDYADKVIVCDDGSTDKTAEVARKNGAIVIKHNKNQGYGAAIIALFDMARQENADIMITLDGDGQHSPNQIPQLIDVMREHNVDVVIGSRFLDKKLSSPRYRKHGIKIITSTLNYGTDLKVTDSQSGFRAYSKRAIDVIHPTEDGMSVSTEILLKISNKGLSIAEVPISILYDGTKSKQNPVLHGTSVLMNTIKFVSVKHPIVFYGIPGIILTLTGIIFGLIFLDTYLNTQTIFYGSLLAAVTLFLLGTILIATAIILFSMANLMKDRD